MKEIYSDENIKKIINSVEKCKALFIAKDGIVFSPEAEELIETMKKFNIYLKPDKVDSWSDNIRKTIYNTFAHIPTLNDEQIVKEMIEERNLEIILALKSYIEAGKIMKEFGITKSWEKAYEIYQNQEDEVLFLSIPLIIKEYSMYSDEFVQNYESNMFKYKDRVLTKIKSNK